jgi:hypothetical protein
MCIYVEPKDVWPAKNILKYHGMHQATLSQPATTSMSPPL